MPTRGEIYSALHDKGMTYEEIGKVYGVTKQAVWDSVAKFKKYHNLGPHAEATVRTVKYKGLVNWMLDNHVSLKELEKRCGGRRLHASLIGTYDPSKKNIDSILAVTGLTYEECFKE